MESALGPNPTLNGIALNQNWKGDESHGRALLPIQLLNGLGERDISVIWKAVCVQGEGQILSVRILQVVGGGRVTDVSGVTVSFKQDGIPTILRLENKPTKLGLQGYALRSWLHPSEKQALRINRGNVVAPSTLEAEFAKLVDIKREMGILHALMREQELTIIHRLKKDFKQCDGIQCMLQTAVHQARDFAHLVVEHFSHGSEFALVEKLEFPEPPPSAQEVRPMRENPAPPAPMPIDGQHRPVPPFEGDHPHPPFEGDHPHPPFEGDHPRPPFGGDHPHPPFEGEFPHPPPWVGGHPHPPFHPDHPPPRPDHEGSPPPPPDHGHGHPPPPSPHDVEHPSAPPHHEDGPYGPLGHHQHGPPPFFQHTRHGRFRILKAGLILLVGCILISLLFKAVRNHIPFLKDARRRADRASRREERRTRCQFRRAAHRHRIASWWAAHDPRRRSAAGTADYDEKRALILQQEGILEAAMQTEIRNLVTGAQLEEGRGRSHLARGIPQESDSQPSNSRREHSAPPPRYEAELDEDMMVVNGFGYTPSNTDSTPESSVVDFSPRMSCETLNTNTTKSDRMD